MQLVDPHTGAARSAPPLDPPEAVEAAVAAAAVAAVEWADTPIAARAAALRRLAIELRARREPLAAAMVAEVGKPVTQALAEVDKCAWTCDRVAEDGPAWLADRRSPSDGVSVVRYAPLGVVLAIMPWNYPAWQVVRFAAPAWLAGDVPLVKHALNVPACAEALQRAAAAAGLPAAWLRVADPEATALVADPRVAAVTLTGSTRAGRAVAAAAGAALKPSVLELGGSDPLVVLADADVSAAAAAAVVARLQNNGQSCIAAKRFIVHAAVADAFLAALTAGLAAAPVGDPADPQTVLGPLARADLRDQLHDQVRRSLAAGARLALGGAPLPGPGFYYPATLLLDCGPGMPVWDEETFGPVAAVRVVDSDAAALAAAAHPHYGLGASVWTAAGDPVALAARLRVGVVYVNGVTRSDARLPFGGVGASGWGRELGAEGARAFTYPQTVWSPLTR